MKRILLLLEHRENSCLLSAWLAVHYQVLSPHFVSTEEPHALVSPDESFDLCILDGSALDHFWEWVQARKASEQPVFLPFLLVTSHPEVTMVTRHLWQNIDELITKPIEKVELRARVEILLRSRQLTVTLKTANKQLQREIDQRKRVEEQIKAGLEEKEVLLKEIHHRVKNNLQVVSSLLNLQSKHIQDQESLKIFKESQNRINSMKLLHEKLYQSENLANINFNQYISNLAVDLLNSYQVKPGAVTLKSRSDEVYLKTDVAVPCGLIINELVTNSLKHAFPVGERGEIYTGIYVNDDNNLELFVRDDGVGFPKDLDFRNTKSLGLQLVNTLASQLRGTVEFAHRNGTEFKIIFPNK